ncbi:hypothetical protein GOODEAATRI_022256 [Goodea atripinnis]|uniref:Eosinophil peroxidase n=1 Tax=Goodea atripinnis TaxID=208336 RepID=A0ABV0PG38_9TELE
MPFFRSAPSCDNQVLPHRHREQLNAITSFVDASMVYGSSPSLASALRNRSSPLGSMALNSQYWDEELPYMPFLPRVQAHLDPCGPRISTTSGAWSRSALRENTTSCFHAVNPIHFLFQILTWEHYLPRVLGERAMSRLLPSYQRYDPDMDPSIANTFATAAFRFAHVTVQPVVTRLGPEYTFNSNFSICHSFSPDILLGGIDPVLRGMLLSPAKLQTPGQMMVEELTERLFQAQGGMPLDLGALNLQRGRDHGLPGYSSWRRFCNLSVPNTTSDLAEIFGNFTLAHKFKILYGTPHNIDVWVGAISEPALPGGRVGPLLFWWERNGVFTRTQRRHLHNVSLSRIICDNSHVTRVPVDPFSRTESPEDMLTCSHPLIPHLDLSPWKEPLTGFTLVTPCCATPPSFISVKLDSSSWALHPSAVMQRARSGAPCLQRVKVE